MKIVLKKTRGEHKGLGTFDNSNEPVAYLECLYTDTGYKGRFNFGFRTVYRDRKDMKDEIIMEVEFPDVAIAKQKEQRLYKCNSCGFEKTTKNVLIAGVTCEKCNKGNFDYISGGVDGEIECLQCRKIVKISPAIQDYPNKYKREMRIFCSEECKRQYEKKEKKRREGMA